MHWSPNKRNIRYQTLADSWTREIFLTKEPEPHSSLTIRNILTFEPTLFCEQEKYFLTINPHSSLIKKNNLIYENTCCSVNILNKNISPSIKLSRLGAAKQTEISARLVDHGDKSWTNRGKFFFSKNQPAASKSIAKNFHNLSSLLK